MEYLQAFILGIVQGVTEFLPISSTAHLKVVPVLLWGEDPGVAFTAVIQLGSIAAVLWYFWQDLTQITTGSLEAIRKADYFAPEFRMAVGIVAGTIPILAGGLLIKIFVPDFDRSPLRSMTTIAIASILMSLLLALAEKLGQRTRKFENLKPIDGILMGLAQTLALVPGVSRSGSTLTAGLFMGMERVAATRFSFLLGIPAITIAGLVELAGILKKGIGDASFLPLMVGIVSSAIFSYLSIALLLKFFQNHSAWIFVWYRLAFGVFILIGVSAGKF